MAEKVILLDEWLAAQQSEAFPEQGKVNYFKRFTSVADYLNREVHPHVEKSALLHQDGFLTDHGPDHIRTLIRRASDLVGDPNGKLSPYEIYLLLMAAHFHDVGNIYGRQGHEKKLTQIMDVMGELLGDDVEKRAIQRIAAAHGGNINGDKDTIRLLPAEEPVLGALIHMQQLAALLRFADELADDYTRASRFLLKLGEIPKQSEVYHRYSASLHSVMVDHLSSSIGLYFSFNSSAAITSYGKEDKEVLLLNEIFDRTIKMHLERLYCARFMRQIVRLDAVNVTIEVFPSDQGPVNLYKIGYRLEEHGYPHPPDASIKTLCPNLEWTGERLREELLKFNNSQVGV